MKRLRNTLIGAIAVTLIAVFVPTAAWAYTALTPGSHLLQPYNDGDEAYPGTVKSIYNSSGQKIGEYELFVRYAQVGSSFVAYANIRVRDTLLGNGRGVKVKLMTKTGTNTSNVIGTYKGGNYPSWSQWWPDQTPVNRSQPVWGFDVDHGEDWSGNPFVYTGYFDRYVKQAETTKDNWPFFAVYP